MSVANSPAKVGASDWGTRLQAVKQPKAHARLHTGYWSAVIMLNFPDVSNSLKSKESRILLWLLVALGGLICVLQMSSGTSQFCSDLR